MNIFFRFLTFILLTGSSVFGSIHSDDFNSSLKIGNHRPTYQVFQTDTGEIFTATRTFEQNHKKFVLLVDDRDFSTSIGGYDTLSSYIPLIAADTNFKKALEKYTKFTGYYNNGLKYFENSKSIFLTIDLCPSSKQGFDGKMFRKLLQNKNLANIAVSISGKWTSEHPKEFRWLLKQYSEKKLNITWINHTYSHYYSRKLPLDKNFLIHDKKKLQSEIFNMEKLLLSYNVVPSVFMRFPGLISDKEILKKCKNYSLIPVGSDTWIAKKETIKPGSIILVHGNLNEERGVKLLTRYISTYNPKFENITTEFFKLHSKQKPNSNRTTHIVMKNLTK